LRLWSNFSSNTLIGLGHGVPLMNLPPWFWGEPNASSNHRGRGGGCPDHVRLHKAWRGDPRGSEVYFSREEPIARESFHGGMARTGFKLFVTVVRDTKRCWSFHPRCSTCSGEASWPCLDAGCRLLPRVAVGERPSLLRNIARSLGSGWE
jgi:hypothetical protein